MLNNKASTLRALKAIRRSIAEKGVTKGDLKNNELEAAGKPCMCFLGHVGEVCQGDARKGYNAKDSSLQRRVIRLLAPKANEVITSRLGWQSLLPQFGVQGEEGNFYQHNKAIYFLNDEIVPGSVYDDAINEKRKVEVLKFLDDVIAGV